MTKLLAFTYAMLVLSATSLHAQDLPITFSGAVSTYYSISLNQPPSQTYAYTTQPKRERTIAVDLAVLSAEWKTESVIVRTSFQAGTWAEANYVGDDASWRFIREVSVAVAFDSLIGAIAGIIPSHIGHESAINAENMLLSRSLIADWTPYYVTGAGVRWSPSSTVYAKLFVVNGWQKIVDNNRYLSLGTQLQYQASDKATISWNTYWGNDEPNDSVVKNRIHNNVWWDHQLSDEFRFVLMADLGLLKRGPGLPYDAAGYGAVKVGWRPTKLIRVGGRVEYMHDPKRVLVLDSPDAFKTVSASLGLDVFPVEHVMIRFESRAFSSSQNVHESFDGLRKRDAYFTIALAGIF